MAEGRCTPYTSSPTQFRYEYQVSDQGGNNVLAFCDLNFDNVANTSEAIQQTHYYPFGMQMYGLGTSQQGPENKYKMANKELQDEFGLQQYDFGARYYDPAIARWNSPDPLADLAADWTPFRYGFNNPMKFSDPSGMAEQTWDGQSVVSTTTGTITPAQQLANDINKKCSSCNARVENGVVVQGGGGSSSSGTSSNSSGSTVSTTGSSSTGSSTNSSSGSNDDNQPQGSVHVTVSSSDGPLEGTANFINHVTNPVVDLTVGAAEYNLGKMLQDRAKYTFTRAPWEAPPIKGTTVIRTPFVNLSASSKALKIVSTALKGAGIALGGAGIVGTGIQYFSGKISGAEASADIIMGSVGFIPGAGWAISGAYFLLAKPLFKSLANTGTQISKGQRVYLDNTGVGPLCVPKMLFNRR